MQEYIYQERYKLTQHTLEKAKIFEIQERGCDYLDYVVIYDCLDNAKSLIEEYKNKKTVCIIGCCENPDLVDDDTKLSYDLYCSHPCSEEDLESLVDFLLSVRTGDTHGDPEDVKQFRISDTNNSFSINFVSGANLKEITKNLKKLINEDSAQYSSYQNIYVSFFSKKNKLKEVDNLLSTIYQEFGDEISLLFTTVEDESSDSAKIIFLCS